MNKVLSKNKLRHICGGVTPVSECIANYGGIDKKTHEVSPKVQAFCEAQIKAGKKSY